MRAITLHQPDLVERLEQVATEEDTSTEELLDRAVIEFLESVALEKLKGETVAFEQLHPQLVQQYFGQHVAIHNGMLVDYDPDLNTLHRRIRAKFGQMPVLIRQVTKEAKLPEITMRGRSLVTTKP
ncbi:MAG: hypothetical protein DYG89_07905 [Caldilinea sp. CFX5]|nr:hypothetical protein [Caldilinea sp. CFX5]